MINHIKANDNDGVNASQFPSQLSTSISEIIVSLELSMEISIPANLQIINYINSYGISEYLGAKYITEASYKPGSIISFSNIRNLFNEIEPEFIEEPEQYIIDLEQFGYFMTPQLETSYEVLDYKALKDYKKELIRLNGQIAEKKAWYDYAALEDLYSQRDFIYKYLEKSINRLGKPRYFVTQANRDRQSVTKAIKSFVTILRKIDPEAGALCDRHLEYKSYVCWRSEPIN
jgi:hypothetical protein